ncbi:hypothetical protein HanPI659440_Chr07g0265031 [Helianthus annuus]|nr:hypothetical protein HanPI659440_Chr07g0265031 [Helianthus annuus]
MPTVMAILLCGIAFTVLYPNFVIHNCSHKRSKINNSSCFYSFLHESSSYS